MLKIIISFAIRAGGTSLAGMLTATILHEIGIFDHYVLYIAVVIWAIGGIYTLGTIRAPFKLSFLDTAGDFTRGKVRDRDRKKLEDEMLRLKKLNDSGILEDDEYTRELNKLKAAYLSD